jgi:hypothetical protein
MQDWFCIVQLLMRIIKITTLVVNYLTLMISDKGIANKCDDLWQNLVCNHLKKRIKLPSHTIINKRDVNLRIYFD